MKIWRLKTKLTHKFLILDDIISSFDVDHRARLGTILLNLFQDEQIIILTHEKGLFEYMKQQVKGRHDWMVNAVHWSEDKGTHLKEALSDLRKQIEIKLKDNEVGGLGKQAKVKKSKFITPQVLSGCPSHWFLWDLEQRGCLFF